MGRIVGAHAPKRRTLLKGIAGAAAALPVAGFAAESKRAPRRMPGRAEVLIRSAYVMTMDPSTGDMADADVHVKAGEIVAVGRNLQAPGARVVDGRKMIVLPGLVETHWHMWN